MHISKRGGREEKMKNKKDQPNGPKTDFNLC